MSIVKSIVGSLASVNESIESNYISLKLSIYADPPITEELDLYDRSII
jgi:hypothetical protein